jgi:hypothetical protein
MGFRQMQPKLSAAASTAIASATPVMKAPNFARSSPAAPKWTWTRSNPSLPFGIGPRSRSTGVRDPFGSG